jgi:Cys-rich protein (TIGR01571 family)
MSSTAKWSTGLCGCFNDCSSCCLTMWCPCVAHGKISDAVSGGGTFAPCCIHFLTTPCCVPQCCLGPQARSNLRSKYGLPASPCGGTFHCLLFLGCACAGDHSLSSGIPLRIGSVSSTCRNHLPDQNDVRADCLVHFCCHGLATCQELRELKTQATQDMTPSPISAATPGKGGTAGMHNGPAPPQPQQMAPHGHQPTGHSGNPPQTVQPVPYGAPAGPANYPAV